MISLSQPKYLFFIGLGYSLFLFSLLAVTGFFSETSLAFGINKTVGFAYSFVAANAVFFIGSQILAVTGYGFLWLFNCSVNPKVSAIHYIIILAMPFLVNLEDKYGFNWFTITASLLTVLLAIINAVFGMYHKIYDKKKRLDN
jgi:hypothetical protein